MHSYRGDNRGHPVSDPLIKRYNMDEIIKKGASHMSTTELTAQIESLRALEELIEEAKAEAETLRTPSNKKC